MSDRRPKVTLLVPVYNRCAITRQFLENLRNVSYQPLEIIIVDDGSPDGTGDMIEREFPSVRLLRTPGEYWWSRCMNLGVQDALGRSPEYILTLNDDVTFDTGFLDALVRHAERHPKTLVGSYVYYQETPDRIWYAGGKVGWLRGELLHRSSRTDGKLRWLTAMGVLIPVGAFADAGRYDEKHFPQYVADAEFSMRAAEKGYTLAVEPSSRIWNKTEESTHVIDRRRVTLVTFFLPFRSIRSAYQFSMRRALYRRHWPVGLRSVAMSAYVLRVLRKQLLRLILTFFRGARRAV